MPEIRNVIIIGSGPAGLTSAIYTARANLEPLLIEGEPSSTSDQPGGQLMLTTEVENFPGWPDGIMGPELMMKFRDQALRFGTEIVTRKVSKVDLSARPFKVWIGDTDAPEPTHLAHSVIVSTGARSLMLGLEEEARLLGHGLSTCATCDGFFSAITTLQWSAVAIPPSKRHFSLQNLPKRSPSSTDATNCARRRSCKIALLPMRKCVSHGTPP